MFGSNPLLTRLTIAKTLGFLYGLAWFFILPVILPEAHPLLRWGVLGLFTTMGGLIGIVGLFDRHPLWPTFRLRWWARGTIMGAWMAALLVLLAYPAMTALGAAFLGGAFASPLWLILEGALMGLLIDYIATRAAGEGPALIATPA